MNFSFRLYLLSCLLCLTSVSAWAANAKWTVLVYMSPNETVLQEAARADFLEMSGVGSNTDLNIVALLDRPGVTGWDGTRRGLINSGDTVTTSWGSEIGDRNLGAATTLASFIAWAKVTYPADHYALILYGHGYGMKGLCVDGSDYLLYPEIQTALETANTHFDLIGTMICNGGMVEAATYFAPWADVFVGSEQRIETPKCWPLGTILGDLKATPTMSAATFGNTIVTRFGQDNGGANQTASAIDLAHYRSSNTTGALAKLNAFCTLAINTASAADLGTLGGINAASYDATEALDVGDYLAKAAAASVVQPLKDAASTALTQYNASILSTYKSSTEASTGLNVFAPYQCYASESSTAGFYRDKLPFFIATCTWADFWDKTAAATDTSAPSWAATYPKADTPTSDGATLRTRAAEPGTTYYVVVASGASAPSVTQVKTGKNASGTAALLSGTIAQSSWSQEATATLSGLSTTTPYDAYFVAADALDNSMTSATKASFTTSRIRYVNPAATGTNDGTSWANAYTSLTNALTASSSGDELWLAAGTYTPGSARTSTFTLKSGVALYGGFAGNESLRSARSAADHPVILSGDIGTVGNAADNTYHVVTASGVTGARLDSLTIRDGNADGTNPASYGGGLFAMDSASSLTLENCTITANSASEAGGGIYQNDSGSTLTLIACRLTANTLGDGSQGGALRAADNGTLTLRDCVFTDNTNALSAERATLTATGCEFRNNTRGAVNINYHDSSPVFTHCVFADNTSDYSGAAIQITNSSLLTVTHSVFARNTVTTANGQDYGGGAIAVSEARFDISHSTFYANTAPGTSATGGALAWSWGLSYASSTSRLTQNIFWGNTTGSATGQQLAITCSSTYPAELTITRCTLPGDTAGILQTVNAGAITVTPTGISTADPLFVSTTDLDGADDVWATADDGLQLQAASPARDAGEVASLPADLGDIDADGNTTETVPQDLAGAARQNGLPDWGAYEAATATADTTPPTNTSTWPKADTTTTTGFTVRAKTNEAGTAYYVVLADGATAPTAAEVKAGTASGGGSALKSGSLAITADTEATAAVTGLTSSTAYDVYVVAQDAAATPNLQSSPTKLDITTASTPVETWRNTYFSQTANTGNAADTADPDGDGIVNLLEYALDADPTDNSTTDLPVVTMTSESKLQINFIRNTGATSLKYEIQGSDDLTAWPSIATWEAGASAWTSIASGASATESPAGTVTITDTTALTAGTKRFMRLKVSQ